MAEDKTKVAASTEDKEITSGITEENNPDTSQGTNEGKEELASTEAEAKVAKAGKRSAKAIKEAEELQAKQKRKAAGEEAADGAAKTPVKPPTRSHLERAGKKFREASKKVETDKLYTIKEALELATQTSTTKFDATVELHINLNVDPRQADQNIRDNVVLPNGTGKSLRVAAFVDADNEDEAKKAGADIIGQEKLLKQIEKGIIEFDILIATPSLMAKLGKHARTLGPKGLMPNPKSGTVTTDITKAIQQAKAGRVEFRVDSTGIVHLGVGKVSFGADKLMTNTQVVFDSIKANKPSSIKGSLVKAITISTTMGPGIKVAPTEL